MTVTTTTSIEMDRSRVTLRQRAMLRSKQTTKHQLAFIRILEPFPRQSLMTREIQLTSGLVLLKPRHLNQRVRRRNQQSEKFSTNSKANFCQSRAKPLAIQRVKLHHLHRRVLATMMQNRQKILRMKAQVVRTTEIQGF